MRREWFYLSNSHLAFLGIPEDNELEQTHRGSSKPFHQVFHCLEKRMDVERALLILYNVWDLSQQHLQA